MATIIKRKNRYLARVRINGTDKAKTFPTKKEAVAWSNEQEAIISTNPNDKLKLTVSYLVDEYYNHVTLFHKGKVAEESMLRQIKKWKCASRPLVSITRTDVIAWRNELSKTTDLKDASINHRIIKLSALFNWAKSEYDMSIRNPCEKVCYRRADSKRTRRVSDDEIASICSYLAPEYVNFVIVALNTAMRRSEVCQLSASRIKDGLFTLPDTKNGKQRTVPINKVAREVMSQQVSFNYHPTTYTNAFLVAARKAGVHDVRIHDLRHEATSRLVELGLSMAEVMSITGHSSVDMALRYTHIDAARVLTKLGG